MTVMEAMRGVLFPEAVPDWDGQHYLSNFVIVGGGPTGVEFAAELHDFFSEDLVNLYPMVNDLVKITLIQSGDHILNTFDERISSFAESKFARDGIDVQTGCQVMSVSDKEISFKVKSKGQLLAVPYGMVVWSTGVGTRPVITDFMEQIGQGNRLVLATDEWLQVKGCQNVYALGDCATIDQRKIMDDVAAIFKAAEKDNSRTLTKTASLKKNAAALAEVAAAAHGTTPEAAAEGDAPADSEPASAAEHTGEEKLHLGKSMLAHLNSLQSEYVTIKELKNIT